MAAQQPPPPEHLTGARVGDHQLLTVGGRAARGPADNGNVDAGRATAPGAHQPDIARGAPYNGNVNTGHATASRAHQPDIARGATDNDIANAARATAPGAHQPDIARGAADNDNANAARAAGPGAHQPDIHARGPTDGDIHRPMPPPANLAQEFLSSMPDVSRSSLVELGLPAYLWPSVN